MRSAIDRREWTCSADGLPAQLERHPRIDVMPLSICHRIREAPESCAQAPETCSRSPKVSDARIDDWKDGKWDEVIGQLVHLIRCPTEGIGALIEVVGESRGELAQVVFQGVQGVHQPEQAKVILVQGITSLDPECGAARSGWSADTQGYLRLSSFVP